MSDFDPTVVPPDLREMPVWILWRLVKRAGKPKPDKVPHALNGDGEPHEGGQTDPQRWVTFDVAHAALERVQAAQPGQRWGLGVCFSPDGVKGIDLDHVTTSKGETKPWAKPFEEAMQGGGYVEVSPSGEGIHFLYVGPSPPIRGCKKRVPEDPDGGAVESYSSGRFFTFTGRALQGAGEPLRHMPDELSALLEGFFREEATKPKSAAAGSQSPFAGISLRHEDNELLELLQHHRGWERAISLEDGEDASGKDWALAQLVLWATHDLDQAERIMRSIPSREREKWNSLREGKSYVRYTLERALRAAPPYPEGGHLLRLLQGGASHRTMRETIWAHFAGRFMVFDRDWFRFRDGLWEKLDSSPTDSLWEPDGPLETLSMSLTQLVPDDDGEGLFSKVSLGRARKDLRSFHNLVHAQRALNAAKGDKSPLVVVGDSNGKSPFNGQDCLLPVANGVLELDRQTGEHRLREYRPGDMFTMRSPVVYDPSAKAPLYGSFLRRVQPDKGQRECLLRLYGYSLTGDTSLQVWALKVGRGANGKTVSMAALKAVLGPLFGKVPESVITEQPGQVHPTGLDSLEGKRVVEADELSSRFVINTRFTKSWSGGEVQKARGMGKDFHEYEPKGKLYMTCNTMPRMKDASEGNWRRILVFRFGVMIPEQDRDGQLTAKISAEASGILNAYLAGWKDLCQRGFRLDPTPAMRAELRVYRDSQSLIRDFVGECLEIVPNAQGVAASDLYNAYKTYCWQVGESPLSQRRLLDELRGIDEAIREYRPEGAGSGPRQRSIRGLRIVRGAPTVIEPFKKQ